jgi:maltose O-acetyltransferase
MDAFHQTPVHCDGPGEPACSAHGLPWCGVVKHCEPWLLWLTQIILGALPPTRFFSLRCRLLQMSGVDIEPTARLCSSVRIITSGRLVIGTDTFIGHQVLIAGGDASIVIGSYCDIAPRVTIVSGSHEISHVGPRAAGRGRSKPIVIEDGVWIGAGSVILGGVRIGRHSVIGAGSVVVRDIPPNSVAFGAPCRMTRNISEEPATSTLT